MNNNEYVAALNKALIGMDESSRADIIRELESHANESDTLLSGRFGPPDELAKQYLDGEIVARPISEKIWGISKKLLTGIALLVLGLLILIALVFWWFSRDAFNYADENSPELSDENTNWSEIDVASDLTIQSHQSSVTFYWHEADNIRWSCEGNSPHKDSESILSITQSRCLIYLPASVTDIEVTQAQVVLVRPQSSLDLTLRQSSLRIAENSETYRYETDFERSNFKALQSQKDAEHTIRIEAIESTISRY